MNYVPEYGWLLAIAAAGGGLLTGLVRRYALARSLIDIPNARSSHSVPTPRGGGVAIVIVFLTALAWLAASGSVGVSDALALFGAGGAVAAVGFLDDHGHVAARWRLLAHFVAAAWALFWLGGAPPLDWYGVPISFGWAGFAVASVYLAWVLNLYNFMDGIDGIAGIEAVSVGCGGAVLCVLVGRPDAAVLPLLLAAAAAGFLYWNFPPARIFMGDAGSGFIGIVLGVLSLQAGWVSPSLLWGWFILLGVFVVDATVTLAMRLCRGKRFYEAHRSHAYQIGARRLGSHLPVTLVVGAINILWLLPLAMTVASGRLPGAVGVAISYAPLILLVLGCRAGRDEG